MSCFLFPLSLSYPNTLSCLLSPVLSSLPPRSLPPPHRPVSSPVRLLGSDGRPVHHPNAVRGGCLYRYGSLSLISLWIYWQKRNHVFIIMFSLAYNHLKLKINVFPLASIRMRPPYLHREPVLFHGLCHVAWRRFYGSPERTKPNASSREGLCCFYVI